MRRRQALAAVAVVAAFLAAVAACSAVLPLSDYDSQTDFVEGGAVDGPSPDAVADAPGADAGAEACTSDSDNCGECGRSCLGATCLDGGLCAPVQALGQLPVLAVALGDDAVYASSGIARPSVIGELPLDLSVAQLPPFYPTDDGGAPMSILVVDDRVYWADFFGAVWSAPTPLMAPPYRKESADGPSLAGQLAASLGPVWTAPGAQDAGGVYRTGGLAIHAPGAWGLAVSGTDVYFAIRRPGGSISRATPLTPVEVIVADAGVPIGLAVDDTSVFWADCLGGAIRRADRSTRVVTTLATGQEYPYAVAVDGPYVYWTTLGQAGTAASCSDIAKTPFVPNGVVARTRKDGTGRPLVLAARQTAAWTLAVRQGLPRIYWGAATPDGASGGVWSVPK